VITGIVVALPEELSTLTSKKIDKGCCVFITDTIILAHSGAGADNARAASELLVAQGAIRLISWGCAAALSTSLKSGDLVLPDTMIDAEGTQIATHPVWHSYTKNLLSSTLKAHTGGLVESKTIVASGKDKKTPAHANRRSRIGHGKYRHSQSCTTKQPAFFSCSCHGRSGQHGPTQSHQSLA